MGGEGKERIQSCSRRHACGTREEDGKPVYDEYEESPYRPYDNFIIIPLSSAPLFLGLHHPLNPSSTFSEKKENEKLDHYQGVRRGRQQKGNVKGQLQK